MKKVSILLAPLAGLIVVFMLSLTGAQAQGPDSVTVVQGIPWQPEIDLRAAIVDECSTLPEIIDHRSPDDPSYSILPRAGSGDFVPVREWAGFIVADTFGCQRAKAGEKYLDLKAIEIKCGPAVLQAQVWDEAGNLKPGTLIFLNWPGAEMFPVEIDPAYFPNGVGGFTDGGGSVGFGFGPGSQLTPGTGGPFNVWGASDPTTWVDRVVGSDILKSVGWFDNHCVFNPVFQVTRKSGEIIPTGGYRLVNVGPNGETLGYISFVEDLPPLNTPRLELWHDDERIGNVPWQSP